MPTPKAPATALQPAATYVDRPEISETFVDSLESCSFVDGVFRLEFAVKRVAPPQPPKQPTVNKVVAARIAMTLPGLMGMANQINGLIAALQKQGTVQQIQTPPPSSIN